MSHLRWSYDPPDRNGWWWFLWPDMNLPQCVEVKIGTNGKPYVLKFDQWSSVLDTPFIKDAQWAGPIEMPQLNPWPWPKSYLPANRECYLGHLWQEEAEIDEILSGGNIEDSKRKMLISRLDKIHMERSIHETRREQN